MRLAGFLDLVGFGPDVLASLRTARGPLFCLHCQGVVNPQRCQHEGDPDVGDAQGNETNRGKKPKMNRPPSGSANDHIDGVCLIPQTI